MTRNFFLQCLCDTDTSYFYLLQILMGVFRLGKITVLLSQELISGFTTGAAVHIFFSQIRHILGTVTVRRIGMFKIPFVSDYAQLCSLLQN